jgi:hypothetical protein
VLPTGDLAILYFKTKEILTGETITSCSKVGNKNKENLIRERQKKTLGP